MGPKKHNVLYLSYDGMTDPLGQSQVLSYLRLLSKQGFSFDIISFEKPDIYASKKQGVQDSLDGFDITWHALMYTKKPPVLSTLKDLRVGWKKIKQLAAHKQFHIVHSRGYTIGNLAINTKKRYGAKMIFDMRGWWADEKRESGLWANPVYRPIYYYFKQLERQLFALSDQSISLTHVGGDEIERLALKERHNISIIPTCVDFNLFPPFNESVRAAVRDELNINPDAKVLLYSGSLGGNYDMSMLLGLFKQLKSVVPNSVLLILSRIDSGYVENEVSSAGMNMADVRLIGVDLKEVHRYLMAGDYGVVNYVRSYSTIGRSPTKLGEYWACGLPVIALSGVGDLDYLIARYPNGGMLIPDNTESLHAKVVRDVLAKDFDKSELRQYALDYYDLNKGAATYASIYRKVLGIADLVTEQ
ncbi:MAG: glycosyltransferase [Chitinophagales bacterium]|nr:glycosyltransferase [Chitinophagales bacterium]